MDLKFFFKVDRGQIQTFLKEGANRGTQTQISVVFKGFRQNRDFPSPVLYNLVLNVSIENIISDRRRKK